MKKKTLNKVFGIGVGENTPAYVDRGKLDKVFKSGLEASRHMSIHGGSKQGKTWLRKKGLSPTKSIVVQATTTSTAASILEEALSQIGVSATLSRTQTGALTGTLEVDVSAKGKAGIPGLAKGEAEAKAAAGGTGEKRTEVQEQLFGQTVANLKWVADAIRKSGKHLIIEDFHYLREDEQKIFAYWVKALGEHDCYVVVIGVWAQSHLLSYFNGDLDGRVDNIRLEWKESELHEVLLRGTEALDVNFSNELANAIVQDSYGNVGLLHRIATEICVLEDVDSAPPGKEIDAGESLAQARTNVAEQMSGRFDTFASNFVRGMRRMSEGLVVYKHLLRAVTHADDKVLLGKGIDSRDLLSDIKDQSSGIRASDLTQALERVDQLQAKIQVSPPVLTYDRPGKRVQLVDRSFLFFRKYGEHSWPWEEDEEIENDLAEQNPLVFDD